MKRLARVLTAAVVGLAAVLAGAPAAHAGVGFLTGRDLVADGSGPVDYGASVGWVTPWDGQRHVAFRDATDNVSVGSSADLVNWSWANATGQAGLSTDGSGRETPWAPYSTPAAYSYDWDHSSHVVYADNNHHIRELWNSQASPVWSTADLTAETGGPDANGMDVTAYVAGGAQHVIYQSAVDSSVWEMLFTPGVGWSTHSLSALTGSVAYYGIWTSPGSAVAGNEQVVAYLNRDTTIHLLVNSGSGWSDQNISAGTGGGTVVYNNSQTLNVLATVRNGVLQRLAVQYLAPGDYLHELAQNAGGGWTDTDVSAKTGAGQNFGLIAHSAVVMPADGSEHTFTENAFDGSLNEYIRTAAGAWYHWIDLSSDSTGAAAFVGLTGTSWTEFVVYSRLSNQHPMLLDETPPNQ